MVMPGRALRGFRLGDPEPDAPAEESMRARRVEDIAEGRGAKGTPEEARRLARAFLKSQERWSNHSCEEEG
jgi:hypothetical protein